MVSGAIEGIQLGSTHKNPLGFSFVADKEIKGSFFIRKTCPKEKLVTKKALVWLNLCLTAFLRC
jgi:hypothetical protein